jgi:uncharacterized protein DUF3303
VLYLVIEKYLHGPKPVYARASERGRMLPAGLTYRESWVEEDDLSRCFQLMETADASLFEEWIANWSDLVEFEVVPVVTSQEAAARMAAGPSGPTPLAPRGRPQAPHARE